MTASDSIPSGISCRPIFGRRIFSTILCKIYLPCSIENTVHCMPRVYLTHTGLSDMVLRQVRFNPHDKYSLFFSLYCYGESSFERIGRVFQFPEDFMFQLTGEEFENLRSRFVTSSWGGRRYLPYAFTAQTDRIYPRRLTASVFVRLHDMQVTFFR